MEQTIFTPSFWAVAAPLCAIVVALSGAINGKFGLKDTSARIVSWVVSVLLSVGAWYLNFVELGEPTWASLIAFAAVVGLISNGVFTLDAIKKAIRALFPEN